MSVDTLRRFYVGLPVFEPTAWLKTVTHPDPAQYEDRTGAVRYALNELLRSNADAPAARALVESTAARVFTDRFPSQSNLDEALRPYARDDATHMSDDMYQTVRDQALRRFQLAAAGCALAEHLDATHLTSVLAPYDHFIDLDHVLPDVPDMYYDVALALLMAARVASGAEHNSNGEPRRSWEVAVRTYLWPYAMQSESTKVPERLGMGVALATRALQPDQGGRAWRVMALPLLWDEDRRAARGTQATMAALPELASWDLHEREVQWLTRLVTGVMENVLRKSVPQRAAVTTDGFPLIIAEVLDYLGLPGAVENSFDGQAALRSPPDSGSGRSHESPPEVGEGEEQAWNTYRSQSKLSIVVDSLVGYTASAARCRGYLYGTGIRVEVLVNHNAADKIGARLQHGRMTILDWNALGVRLENGGPLTRNVIEAEKSAEANRLLISDAAWAIGHPGPVDWLIGVLLMVILSPWTWGLVIVTAAVLVLDAVGV